MRAVWDLSKAYQEATPTRGRVCINGLWRWQPAKEITGLVPADDWGYFKVPGPWPGRGDDAMREDCQTVHSHPSWQGEDLGEATAAWYQREITIPKAWAGRRIGLHVEYLNSYAAVHVDGKKTGELRFPWGELDLTSVCHAGRKHVLSMLVVALPLKGVMLSFSDTNAAREAEGTVTRRGLCGDVYLVATPADARITDVKVDTSVRRGEITFRAALQGLAADDRYALRARITESGRSVRTFKSKTFAVGDLREGHLSFTGKWLPDKLWDLHTPQNMYQLSLSLLDAKGKVLDAALPVRFGFRELWIEGRDFYLNGSRIFLSAVPMDNAGMGAAWATYEAVKESLSRLKAFGTNFVYTHNYGCEPGSHISFAEALRAADDVGMLVALSQPHYGHYDWGAPDAEQSNGYADHAAFYVHVAGNHPSVAFYATSHNATGYMDDANPDAIDGIHDPRPDWARNSIKPALQAEAMVRRMDPARIVYHHSSGNLSAMYTLNFYLNFAPIQEQSDWFEHWATKGVKPLFTCEYAVPCTWDWTMYRGWYRGARTFGSAVVPWEFCLAEWNSQFVGEQAFRISEPEKANLRWEAKRFRSGQLWHRWDYPYEVGSREFEERYPVFARYITDNWRAFRTWGLSGSNAWEYWHFWKLREGADKARKQFRADWDHLQRPGFSPDYVSRPYDRLDAGYQRSDWTPTVAGQALVRNNMPLLAYIGGKPARFTSKDHNFYPGEAVEKQLIIINNSRQTVSCDCRWSFGLPQPVAGSAKVTVATGSQERIPIRFELPAALAPGRYELTASIRFSTGETQQDSFSVHVLALPQASSSELKIALFDPKGETGQSLRRMGVQCQPVGADVDLSGYDLLVVGKGALTVDAPAPDIGRVREGLRVLLFEQAPEVLEKRFGFRVAEYGLRQVFRRVPGHPLLAGLGGEHLQDWRGEATILPPRLKYEIGSRYAPTVKWCDIDVTRVWRCGNRGNVASVLIEKPVRGDFLPVLDGGFSLQYSPLMEYREGKGMILFCQMDVTGRSEQDPAAETLARNIMQYAAGWKPKPTRKALYIGHVAGKRHLEAAGVAVASYEGGGLSAGEVLVVGAGGGRQLAEHAAAISDFVKAGGNILALGLDEEEANAFLPFRVRMTKAEHIAAFFEAFGNDSLLSGVSPADVHNRDPRELPLVTRGATVIGDGVLAKAEHANVVFWQLPPYDVTSARGAVASFVVDGGDAVDGKQSALVTMGSTTEAGGQLGQVVRFAPQIGKSYTFAALAKGVGGPISAHLEVERAGSPWDRAAKGPDIMIPEGRWTELHITFKCEKPFPEGWQAYIACAQEGGRFRADMFRLFEGEYVPWEAPVPGAPTGPQNLITNPSFETGEDPWWFTSVEQYNLRRTYRRASFTLTRTLANMGVAGSTPILARFSSPLTPAHPEKRWLDGLYLDEPEEWDDPYRFFGW
jgi:hypothetical protein